MQIEIACRGSQTHAPDAFERNLQDGDLVIDSKCGRLSINIAKNTGVGEALNSIFAHALLVISSHQEYMFLA